MQGPRTGSADAGNHRAVVSTVILLRDSCAWHVIQHLCGITIWPSAASQVDRKLSSLMNQLLVETPVTMTEILHTERIIAQQKATANRAVRAAIVKAGVL